MTTPVITKETATELVQMYFESQRLTEHDSAYDKFCMLFNNRRKDTTFLGNDPQTVFCAIRLLEENAEGKTDDNQVDLLRQAVQDYKSILTGQIKMGSLIGIGAKL